MRDFSKKKELLLNRLQAGIATNRDKQWLIRYGFLPTPPPQEPTRIYRSQGTQADQNFYEKKERLLRYVQAGTATEAQKAWLIRWGFLEKPRPTPMTPAPPQEPVSKTAPPIGRTYRYRGPMKVTPISKLEAGGPGARTNRYGKVVLDHKGKRRSVFAKSQTMRQ